jgi:hypothetical protein
MPEARVLMVPQHDKGALPVPFLPAGAVLA